MHRMMSVFLAAMLFSGCLGSESISSKFHGQAIDPAISVTDFTLLDSQGGEWNWAEHSQGKVMVVVFLFTNCIDVCPVVTQNMKWIENTLTDSEKEKVGLLTITVDPWRDDNFTLTDWKLSQNVSWPHLTVNDTETELESINAVWTEFGISLTIVDESSEARHHPSSYDVNHTTGTVLVDDKGLQRVWWGDLEWVPDLVLADVRTLLSED